MADLIDLGLACDGLDLVYDSGDGILLVVVLGLRSPLNSSYFLSRFRFGIL